MPQRWHRLHSGCLRRHYRLDADGLGGEQAITLKSGHTHVHRYLRPLLERIEKGELDPSFIVTHRMSLEEAPRAFKLFRDKREECVKVVLKPDGLSPPIDTSAETAAQVH